MTPSLAPILVLLGLVSPSLAAVQGTDPETLVNNCERISSGSPGIPIGDTLAEVQTARLDSGIAVSGFIVDLDGGELTFQSHFGASGKPLAFRTAREIVGCSSDPSKLDRRLFPKF